MPLYSLVCLYSIKEDNKNTSDRLLFVLYVKVNKHILFVYFWKFKCLQKYSSLGLMKLFFFLAQMKLSFFLATKSSSKLDWDIICSCNQCMIRQYCYKLCYWQIVNAYQIIYWSPKAISVVKTFKFLHKVSLNYKKMILMTSNSFIFCKQFKLLWIYRVGLTHCRIVHSHLYISIGDVHRVTST